MLAKKHRLPSFMIPQVLKQGKWFRSKLFDLIILQNSEFDIQHSEFCIIVPFKLSKKAVVRNRTKRLFVESIHKIINNVKPGFKVILMAKKTFEKEKLQDIIPKVKTFLSQTNLLKTNFKKQKVNYF